MMHSNGALVDATALGDVAASSSSYMTSSSSSATANGDVQLVATLRSTHAQMAGCIGVDLLTACQREVCLDFAEGRNSELILDDIDFF